jgi:hypothetical protein
MKEVYIKDNKIVLVDSECRFIYEVLVYVWYDNIFSLANSKIFTSVIEIPNIIESYFIDKHIEFFTFLYAAPKKWLVDNDFIEYIYPEKKKRIKKEENEKVMSNKLRIRKSTRKTSSTRIKKL